MATHYLLIDGRGNLYEKSKTPKEGFEKHEWSFGEKSGVHYRKPYKDVTGLLENIKIQRSSEYGDKVDISLKDGEDYYHITTPLMSKYGLDSFTENLVLKLPNLEKGTEYRVSPYVFTPEEGGRTYRGFTFWKDGTEKVEKALTFQTNDNPDGDIPPLEVTEKLGKTVYNSDKRDEFLYQTLLDYIESEFSSSNGGDSAPKEEPETQESTPSEDDLPF